MKNIFRFLIGLGVAIVSLAIIIFAIAVLSPLAILSIILGSAIWIIVAAIYVLGIAFAFIWYLSRKEETPSKKTNYSINQGKEIK